MDAEYDPNAVVDKSFKRKKKMSKFVASCNSTRKKESILYLPPKKRKYGKESHLSRREIYVKKVRRAHNFEMK